MPADHGVGETIGNVTYYRNLVQGSDEWFKLRLGVLTASEMKLVVTPTFKAANNDKVRAHVYELAAQRISQFIEPTYIGDAMLRGHEDEIEARIKYEEKIAPVREMGFITNSKWGFTLGYSPDGLVGENGGIECKSRIQKYQVQTIAEHVHDDKSTTIPAEFMAQCQTGMLVAELDWIDFISYSGGLPMVVIRVHPDPDIQAAIIDAATEFEMKIQERMTAYRKGLAAPETRAFPTVRRIEEEMMV
ncbi:YqaJ-like viral recombinase [Sulfitobacter sp. EhC04]|nr:YqaJ-like viral recombinase [Sulfitobacter sp. EhC04]